MCMRLHEFMSTTARGHQSDPHGTGGTGSCENAGSHSQAFYKVSKHSSLQPPILCFLKENINVWAILVNNDQDVLIMLHLFFFINV